MSQPKSRVYMSGEENKHEEFEDGMHFLDSHRLCTLYSEAHPVILMQRIQEYLEGQEITPIICNEEWTVTYQVPMKLGGLDCPDNTDVAP
jgi:hypothetical protein